MKQKDPDTLISIPSDVISGIVLKVGAKEAVIKARGVVGKLPIENARWAANRIDSKTGGIVPVKDFSLEKILAVGDIVKVGVKATKGKTSDLTLEQEPDAEGALVALDPTTGFIRAMVGGHVYL